VNTVFYLCGVAGAPAGGSRRPAAAAQELGAKRRAGRNAGRQLGPGSRLRTHSKAAARAGRVARLLGPTFSTDPLFSSFSLARRPDRGTGMPGGMVCPAQACRGGSCDRPRLARGGSSAGGVRPRFLQVTARGQVPRGSTGGGRRLPGLVSPAGPGPGRRAPVGPVHSV
jgi:hypothetical protein